MNQYELCKHCGKPIFREVDENGKPLRGWVHASLTTDGVLARKRYVHCEPLPTRAEPGGQA